MVFLDKFEKIIFRIKKHRKTKEKELIIDFGKFEKFGELSPTKITLINKFKKYKPVEAYSKVMQT